MVRDHSHSFGFRFTLRHSIILIVYFAVLFRVILPFAKLASPASIGNIALVALMLSPPLLAVLVVFIERPGPLKNWALSLLVCLFFPGLVLNHDRAILFAYLENGQRPTLWATLLVNAVVLTGALPYAGKLIPRSCPKCGWRTLIPLMRMFKKDKRTGKTCWCASCGSKYWKDREGNWQVERRKTWIDEAADPLPTSATQASPGASFSMTTNTRTQPRKTASRRGVASAELAVVLSTLTFICLATCDYARCVFATVTVANCARNGALYQCDPTYAATMPYATLQAAVQADAGDLSPAPTGSSTTGTDANANKYVAVTVTYPFQCLINYPGIPDSFTISRTVSMAAAPSP